MRVLLVTDWKRRPGGAEAAVSWLRDGLRAVGDQVRLLTSSAGAAGDGTADFVAFGTERIAAQAFLQIANPFAARAVRRALREFRPDIVLVSVFEYHLSPSVLYALASTPTLLQVVDYKCVCPLGSKLLPDGSLCRVDAGWVCCRGGCLCFPHWLRDQVRYAYLRPAVRGVDRVLTCSRWLQRELAAAGIRSEVVPLPVPAPAPDFVRRPAPDPVFVYCGRLEAEKGVYLLLRAFAGLHRETPSARLRIVGQGAEREKLERLAGELGLGDSVAFTGWLAPAQVERQLHDAWAALVPSLWAEPLGLVAIEAIVRGVPVVASAAGGLGEIVTDGVSGFLFPNGDQDALTQRLRVIAAGSVFPRHNLPDEVVRQAADIYDLGKYIAHMRRVFTETVGNRH